jgi:hypothetical protein
MYRNIRAVLAIGIALVLAHGAMAQSPIGPRVSAPPSYGPPVSPAMLGHEATQITTGFNLNFTVEIAEIQKFLPAGYTPIPSAPGATTTSVIGIFASQVMLRLNAPVGSFQPGTYGPYESFDLALGCFTPPGSLRTFESVFIGRFVNNAEIADLRAAFGAPGETLLADIDIRIIEGFGEVRMKGRVEEPTSGFKVVAEETGPAEVTVQLRQFGPIPLRSTNFQVSPPTAGTGALFTTSSDNTANTNVLDVGAKQIRLGGKKLKVLDVVPGNFFYNSEVHLKRD